MSKGDKQSRERIGPHLAALRDGTIAAASSSLSVLCWRRKVVVAQHEGNGEVSERRTQDYFRIGAGDCGNLNEGHDRWSIQNQKLLSS